MTNTALPRIAVFDDDHEDARATYRKMFARKADHRFYTSRYLVDNIEALVGFQPNLIIVDLLMEGSLTDGLDLIKELQADERFRETPIAICSDFAGASHVAEKMKLAGEFRKFPPVDDFLNLLPHAGKA